VVQNDIPLHHEPVSPTSFGKDPFSKLVHDGATLECLFAT